MEFDFPGFQDVTDFYKKVINFLRQMNFKEFNSKEFKEYEKQLDELLAGEQAEVAEI